MINWQRLIFLLCLFATQSLFAQTYYFASAGNDSNDGFSPETAWQTVTNLNEKSFSDGDSFLFKRGDTFRGGIKLLRSPTNLTFSTYGEGDRAVIAGSVAISNWTPTVHSSLNSGLVYEANVTGLLPLDSDGNIKQIQHLFVNGNLMTIARYPNVNSALDKNWLKVGSNTGKDYFTDPTLAAYGKPDNYWKGATLRIRNSWTNEVSEITGYSAAAGRLAITGLGTKLPEWGYFIDGKLEELDFTGEWYYDATSQKVYLYPPAGVNPNQALIEGAVYETGLSINNHKDNALVENLLFRHFTTQGMHVNSSDNVRVQQCYFLHNVKGITTWNTADLSINNNELHYQLHSSIGLQASVSQGFDVKGSVVENNTITNTAMYRAYGVRYDGKYQGNGIDVYGKAYTVRGNYIENVAENGMFLKDGGYHLIENNVIKNTLLILNDGGAISIGSDGNTIRGNYLSGSVGNTDESNGCSSTSSDPCKHHSAYGMGIGSDSGFKNNVIENNVIFNNADMGIRLNAFQNAIVRNNIVYNNDPQIVVQDLYGGTSSNNLIENNIIISLDPDQLGLQLTNTTHHGDMNNNYYCNPYSDLAIMRDGQRYSLADWKQSFSQYDQSSVDCGLLLPTELVQVIGEQLITNPTFDADVKSWGPTSKPEKIFYDTTQLDNGSLKAVFNTSDRLLNLVPNTLSLQKDQWYRLAFSVIADDFGDIQLRLNQTKPKYVIYEERFFAIDTQRRDYQYIFQNQLTDDTMKFLFSTEKDDAGTYWIDNVNLQAVTLQPSLPAEKQVKLFTNPSYETKTVNLQGVDYLDLAGQLASGEISLAPFTSAVLVRANSTITAPATLAASKLHVKVKQNKVTLTWTAVMGAQGYLLYYTTYPNAQPQLERVDMQLNRKLELEVPEGFELPIDGIGFYAIIVAYDGTGAEGRSSNIEHFMLH
ncbi:right-handed parallel beta-helix repeat-containing protein [Candidatus Albibeggiatoa sp. nov. BB20]|uniref:right-handed parallel beta-helix repeat-containing protein n=1 Tax=Candidatus Albibeggiatoa sp. nov. BB20 TaxID=3162723 RepID=UPI0033654F0C